MSENWKPCLMKCASAFFRSVLHMFGLGRRRKTLPLVVTAMLVRMSPSSPRPSCARRSCPGRSLRAPSPYRTAASTGRSPRRCGTSA
eukprot:2002697-Pyramimonas_sp.AAC.1